MLDKMTKFDKIYMSGICLHRNNHRMTKLWVVLKSTERKRSEDLCPTTHSPWGYMTCRLTMVCRPVFRKVASCFMHKRNLLKIESNLEDFGLKNPPIWAAHNLTLCMLCTSPGLTAGYSDGFWSSKQ